MTEQEIRDANTRFYAQQILATVPAPPPVTTAADLDAAVNAALPGETIVLDPSLVYAAPFTLAKTVTLQSATAGTGRMTVDEPAPKFLNGFNNVAVDARFFGLEIRNATGMATVVTMTGPGAIWDRCRVLGDPVLVDARHGFQWIGGKQQILRCYVEDIFHPTADAQAVIGWDCDPGLVVDDCYLSASGQSAMFGGSDSVTALRIPQDILMTNNDCTKRPEWVGKYQVKCAIEFKSAIRARVLYNRLSYAGKSQGQGSYLIVATVRNQNGKAPWSCISSVEIANCTGGHAAGICNILGTDNDFPSGVLDGLNFHDCSFDNIDGTLGEGRIIKMGAAPKHVTFKNLTVDGVNIQARAYFYTPTPPVGLIMAGMSLPTSHYGYKLDGNTSVGGPGVGGQGRNDLMKYAPDAALDATVV
jgi:hypothetical protein